jgi:outer membrane biosynthesis protein TonB
MSDEPKKIDPSLKTPLIVSGIFHVVLLLLVIFGLPHFKKDVEMVDVIPVDLVADISELTTTNKPPVKAPPKEEPKKDDPPPKAKEKPQPQKEPPKPPPQEELEPPQPEEDVIPKEEPKEKPKKEEPKKEPPKEKLKKEEPKEDSKDQPQDFDKLLKNLATEDPPQPEADEASDEELMTSPESSPDISRISDTLTMSEMDALRQQLSGCWNIMAGAQGAEDLKVEVRLVVNRDRTVATAEIVDMSRYNSDTFFRSMAESALRAVKNPRCSPLLLPEDKYNTWKNLVVVFDPREMF